MPNSSLLPDRLFLWSRQAGFIGNCMRGERKNCFPTEQFPPIRSLAQAIKRLPRPGPDARPQTVEIDAVPGRYRVTFSPRQRPHLKLRWWYWGVETSERLQNAGGGVGEVA